MLALARRGYSVDGVDFSPYLLTLAKKSSDKTLKHQPTFFWADVTNLVLKKNTTVPTGFFPTWRASIQRKRSYLSVAT